MGSSATGDDRRYHAENALSGNNLWQHLVAFLTVTPDKMKMRTEREHPKPSVGERLDEGGRPHWRRVSLNHKPTGPFLGLSLWNPDPRPHVLGGIALEGEV